MFTITPQLLPRKQTIADDGFDGWYLPGDQISQWTSALLPLSKSAGALALFVIPASIQDRTPRGLVCLTSSQTKRRRQVAIDCAIPLRKLSENTASVWIPADGGVIPTQSLAELSAFELESTRYVWLPSCGLVRLDSTDQLQLSDLFRRPANKAQRSWVTPPLVAVLPDRIVDIEVVMPPTQFLFAQEQQDIGGDNQSLMDLNSDGTTEPKGATNKLASWFRSKIQEMYEKRAEKQRQSEQGNARGSCEGGSCNEPGHGSRFMQFLSKHVLSQREAQIDKLLKLMKRDPDRGLQFAIPMGGKLIHRGFADAGSRLVRRETDFSLSGLFDGGRPVDLWDLGDRARSRLREAYLEQARREIAMGRFRRAAYIHAHLLNDLLAAAELLERGGHFKEAAVLFGDHLQRPFDQARCLEGDGQFNRAAELYESLKKYDDAARVWELIGESEAAKKVYENAVAKKIEERQIIAAATILIEKLDEPQRAEELLWEQWPSGAEALQCALMVFKRCGDSDRHEFSRQKFSDLTESSNNDLQLAKLAASLAKTYPDQQLRETAEDRCRLSAAISIDELSDHEIGSRLSVLQALHPDDVVLQRDLRRFRSIQRDKQPTLRPTRSASARGSQLPLLSPYKIVSVGRIVFAMPVGKELFVVHEYQNTIELLRVCELLSDSRQVDVARVVLYKGDQPMDTDGIRAAYSKNSRGAHIEVDFPHARHIAAQFKISPLGNSTSKWDITCSSETAYAEFDSNGNKWTFAPDNKLLREFRDGNLYRTIDLVDILRSSFRHWNDSYMQVAELNSDRVMLSITRDVPMIAYDRMVLALWNGQMVDACLLQASPNFVASSLPYTKSRTLIGTTQSLELVTRDTEISAEVLCSQDGYQQGCFLFGGKIAATTGDKLRVFGRTQNSIRLIHENRLPSAKVVRVFPIGTSIVGVMLEGGLVHRLKL